LLKEVSPSFVELLEELLNFGGYELILQREQPMNDQLAILPKGAWNGATNFVNIFLLHVGVLQDLDGFHGLPEEIHVGFFKFGTGKCLGEVIAILEALNFDTRALLARKCPLSLLNPTLEFSESAEILGNVGTSFLLGIK
jgi:hypothetical protein